jgi:hypothetical protein
MIYFIGNKELDVCKIGFSKRPYRRIDSIRKSIPFNLEILAIIDGDFMVEKMYHSKYFEHKIKGEWFTLSKVLELGINNSLKELYIGSIKLNVNNENHYIHLPSLISLLNQDRVFLSNNLLHFNLWEKSNKEFLSTIENPIIKSGCTWIHPYVCCELIRSSSVQNKIMLYENMRPILELAKICDVLRDNNQAIRIGISQAIKK